MQIIFLGDIIINIKNFILAVSLALTLLVAILMERSFIAKEKAEIAMLKAVGFSSSVVIKIHIYRFVVVGIISSMQYTRTIHSSDTANIE